MQKGLNFTRQQGMRLTLYHGPARLISIVMTTDDPVP